ncbi:MAG TPA: hypothetical protein VMF52_10915 [Steroidobacteraceae bacterium]|nr:hypothetical protein [Steroidobacteraceae bacterium]
MRAFFLRAVEALPLAVFLLYMAWMDPRAQTEWRVPYYAATALAGIGTWLLVRMGATLNRIYLGIALYFVSGTVALLTRWPWLNEEYGRLEGTAMLYWVLATGIVCTYFSRRGFTGIDADPGTVRRSSYLLLGITFIATAVSGMFVGRRVLSSFLPFIVVFTAAGIIKAKIGHNRFRGTS